jgi:hypothetical protein
MSEMFRRIERDIRRSPHHREDSTFVGCDTQLDALVVSIALAMSKMFRRVWMSILEKEEKMMMA